MEAFQPEPATLMQRFRTSITAIYSFLPFVGGNFCYTYTLKRYSVEQLHNEESQRSVYKKLFIVSSMLKLHTNNYLSQHIAYYKKLTHSKEYLRFDGRY